MQYDNQTQQQMFLMIASWQQSGLDQKTYCEQHSIRYHVFHYWYKKYRDAQLSAPAAIKEHGFIPLQLTPPPATAFRTPAGVHTELILPDGRRLLFHHQVSVDYLKTLIG